MSKLTKRLTTLISTILVTTSFAFTTFAPVIASADVVLSSDDSTEVRAVESSLQTEKMEDGVILHAWCWSFDEIKNNMAEIAAAGYTSVQTSPAQACAKGKTGYDESLVNTKDNPSWYYHYQPTYYTLGNYQLGTANQFKAMCDAAEEYGIKIIVDVVPNHLATISTSLIDSELLNNCHTGQTIKDWSNRTQVTQGKVIGMPDLNTASSVVQNKMINYLNELIDAGADGFRFDAAKSIELPQEPTGAPTSDYWPNIIRAIRNRKPDALIYGEVLQGDEPGTNFPGYAKIMHVTGSTYGWFVRSAVGYEVWENGTLGGNGNRGRVNPVISEDLVSKYMEGQVKDGSIKNSQLVTFVETHDTYANEGASRAMSQKQIQLAWAMVAAREGSVPLFFNRPTAQSFGNDYLNPQGEPYKTVGQRGSDDFKQKDVVEINKFHNVMEENNQGENVSRINNNNVMKIERGNKGVVLVNVSGGSQSISTSTTLENGTYTNMSSAGGTFEVSNGTLRGNLNGESMAILYKVDTPITKDPVATISQAGGTFTGDSLTLTLGLSNATSGTYKIGSDSVKSFTSSTKITIGSNLKAGESVTLALTATNGTSNYSKSYTFTKTETPVSSSNVYCVKPSGWGSKLYIYAYSSGTSNLGQWPGKEMTNEGDGLYSYELPEGWSGYVIFNDGGNQYPGSGQTGLTYTAGKSMKFENGKWEEYSSVFKVTGLSADKTTVNRGEEVQFKTTVTGGAKPYTYEYTVNGEEIVSDANGTATWTAKEVGTYEVKVNVTDATGLSESKTMNITVEKGDEKAPYIESITSTLESTKITYTVNAIGGQVGTGLLFYKFYIVDSNGNKTIAQNYSLNNKLVTSSSNKKIYVEVQNSLNTTVSSTYEYTERSDLSLAISADQSSPALLGSTIKVSAKASNASGTVNYKYTIKDSNGNITFTKAYSTSSYVNWTPDTVGNYTITVEAKDSLTTDKSTMNFTIYNDEFDELKINSYKANLSSPQNVGTAIKLGMTAEGEGTVLYKFEVVKGGKTYLSRNFATTNNTTWTPSEAGTYTINFIVTDDTGKEVSRSLSYTIAAPQELSFTETTTSVESPQAIGSSITIAAKAVGVGTVKYRFVVAKDGKNYLVKDYGVTNNTTWAPSEAGTYTIYYRAKDDSGKVITTTKSFVVTKGAEISSFTASKTSPQQANTSIVLRANVEGNTGAVQSKFTVQISGGKEVTIQDYSDRGYIIWKPTTEGTYTLKVYVKDGTTVIGSKTMNFVIGSNKTLKITSSKINPETEVVIGNPVKLGVTAEGQGKLQYRFAINKDGKNVFARAYNENNYATWTPKEAGTYTIYYKVKDESGKEVSTTKTFIVKSNTVELKIGNLTTNVTSPQKVGTAVTITASATGKGELKYRYVVMKGALNVYTRVYSSNEKANWTPSEAGDYTIICKVKDETGKEVSKSINFTVTDAQGLSITSFKSNVTSPQTVGSTIKFGAAATGKGAVQYRFVIMKDGINQLTKAYSTTNYVNWKPAKSGTYQVICKVKDETGKEVSKTLTYVIK